MYAFSPVTGQAAEAGRLVEKDGKYVFVESMDPALKLMLDRSLKSGLITQEDYDRILRESETRNYLLQPSFKGWYDRGFNLSMNDNAFFLKIRFRTQIRYTQRFRNDAWRNPGDASIGISMRPISRIGRQSKAMSTVVRYSLIRSFSTTALIDVTCAP
jgi:hypothetical protein